MFYVSARGNFAGRSKPMNQNFPLVFPYNFSANFSRLTGNTRVYCEGNRARDHIVYRRVHRGLDGDALFRSPPQLHTYTHTQPLSRLMYFCSSKFREDWNSTGKHPLQYNIPVPYSVVLYRATFSHPARSPSWSRCLAGAVRWWRLYTYFIRDIGRGRVKIVIYKLACSKYALNPLEKANFSM